MSHPGPGSPDSSGSLPPGPASAGQAALLQRLTEFAPLGIYLMDATGRLAYANPRMLAITGRDLAWLSGEDWPLTIHPDDRERVLAAIREFMAGAEPRLHLEYRIVHADGTERRVSTETARVLDASGRTEGYAGSMEDVSERHALEARAREAQKMEAVGRLAGGIAHDFNNLLTVIRTYTEFLAADLPEGDPRRADVHQVLAATERAAALTRQLLAFGRRQPAAARAIDPAQAIRDLKPVLERVTGTDVRVVVEDGDAGVVQIDPGQLEQVLLNLVRNAREATPAGTLTISTSRATLTRQDIVQHALESPPPAGTPEEPGEYVVLAVRDTGRGMDRATQARMFEPFFTTKAPGAGVGLGLSTVWGIVTQAGGHLRVRSTAGEGTTVEVWLPVAAPAAPPRRASGAFSASALAGAGTAPNGTILLVEDEPAVRTSVRRILERAGYRVLEARHGLDAKLLWETRREEIALVLTDVVMPEVDGTELASVLRAQSPDVRFVFMSGYTGDQPTAARRLGPHDLLLEKPFEARTLLERVRQALEG